MSQKVIKIAPSAEEITRNANVFTCEFNGMKIKWVLCLDCNDLPEEVETKLKDWLSAAIAMSGKIWQVPFILNKNLIFASEVYVNDKLVEYT